MKLGLAVIVISLAAAPLAADQGEPALKDSPQTTRVAAKWGGRGPFGAGTRVRMKTLDRKVLTGSLFGVYGLDSLLLRLCPTDANGCLEQDSVKVGSVPTDSLSELEVWGKSGAFTYTGALLGAGTGLVIGGADKDAGGIGLLVGLVAGMFLGHQVDKGRVAWTPVFPCHHGCASGGSEVVP